LPPRPHAPEENASTRILRRHGFDLEGTVIDAEDGEVWRWSLERADEPALRESQPSRSSEAAPPAGSRFRPTKT
jgi:hypothetical protein